MRSARQSSLTGARRGSSVFSLQAFQFGGLDADVWEPHTMFPRLGSSSRCARLRFLVRRWKTSTERNS